LRKRLKRRAALPEARTGQAPSTLRSRPQPMTPAARRTQNPSRYGAHREPKARTGQAPSILPLAPAADDSRRGATAPARTTWRSQEPKARTRAGAVDSTFAPAADDSSRGASTPARTSWRSQRSDEPEPGQAPAALRSRSQPMTPAARRPHQRGRVGAHRGPLFSTRAGASDTRSCRVAQ